jgi:curved DNA-binding protein
MVATLMVGVQTMEFKDYYQTLGVSKQASQRDIKSAFRRLARKYHPDINPGDKQAEDKFKEINEAHEVLSDPEKRKKYDELGANWKYYEQYTRADQPQGAQEFRPGRVRYEYRTASPDDLRDLFGDDSAFSDFFSTFFGGGGGSSFGGGARQPPRRRGGDLEYTAEISLEEAFNGTSRTVRIKDASGCQRKVDVKIPAGIRDGMRVRAAGQGGQGRDGGPSGDLFLKVNLRPHPSFERRGDDLHTTASVPLLTCVLGGEVTLSTLSGSVILKIPPETQNGRVFRLRGQGMPKLGQTDRGNLYVEVQAALPKRLTADQRRLFEELASIEAGSSDNASVDGGVR